MTTHNTHNRQTSMPPVGFEPTISAGERPQTYTLDRAVTGTGRTNVCIYIMYACLFTHTHTHTNTRARAHKLTPWSRVLVETLIVVFSLCICCRYQFCAVHSIGKGFSDVTASISFPLFSVTVVPALTSTFTSHITSLNNVKYINLCDATLITH